MGKIKEFAPFDGRDFEYIESYLCDMAKKGLVLERYGLCYAEFKESEPIQRRFRIVPKLQRMVTDEEIELYKESGWNYLGKKWGSGLNIFIQITKMHRNFLLIWEVFVHTLKGMHYGALLL